MVQFISNVWSHLCLRNNSCFYVAIEIVFNCIAAPNALREIDKEIQREYEVIHKVHMHLDDDHSGMVDKKETAEVSSLTRVLYLE